jgi:mono/diheme cytochrome c family protein
MSQWSRLFSRSVTLTRFAALMLCAFTAPLIAGCGNLSAEPGIVRTAAVPTLTPTAPADRGAPAMPVSLLAGAEIYNGAQGCQNCHGTSGKGDGPTAASLTCKVPDLTDPNTARDATLAAWFAITTNGNGQTQGCLMPPWKNRLTEQQRWDVTAFMYGIQYKPAQLQAGKGLWAENCAACHGDKGLGDGPRAKDTARPVTNLADTQYMISHSDNALFSVVTHGLGNAMPAFPQLSEDQRWAVVAYARSLSWQETISPGSARPVQTTADPNVIQVQQTRLLLEFPGPHVAVQQGFSFVNTSTQAAALGADGVALRVLMPVGASQVTLDADMRANFSVEQAGNAPVVVSRVALKPGETRPLVVGYILPMPNGWPLNFNQPTLYNVQETDVFFDSTTGLAVKDREFIAGDPLALQNTAGQSTAYRQYQRQTPILSGLPLTFTLDLQSNLQTAENSTRRTTLAVVIGAALAAFALVGVGAWRIGRPDREA